MPTEPANLRVLADFATDAIAFNLIDAAQVVAWADGMIADSQCPPPPWTMDLSLVDVADFHAVRDALGCVPGEPDAAKSIALLNGLTLREWRKGRLAIGRLRSIGWRLSRGTWSDLEDVRWGDVVEDMGESLDEGWVTEAEMRTLIECELAVFDPNLRQLPSSV